MLTLYQMAKDPARPAEERVALFMASDISARLVGEITVYRSILENTLPILEELQKGELSNVRINTSYWITKITKALAEGYQP